MHGFRVWAPGAERVEVVSEGRRLAMARAADGWWRRDEPDAGPGTRYRFSLDGGEPLADPRSPSQPEGADGPSEVVDHAAFRWSDERWRGVPLAGSVLYEMHVGTFTPGGTFDAAAGRIPYLVELGVDAVELMPVAEFPGRRGWGYDGIHLFAPHHAYGGPDGLKRFVDACHAAGIGVVMDVVYNHLGPGNRLADFGPYFTDRHATAWGAAVNFDGPGSDEVRRFVLDNALTWLRDYHVDGLRLDAVHAIVDTSAVHLLEQMATEVGALAAHLRRPLFLVAESDLNDPRFVRSREAGGYGLDGVWADEWHHALHATLTGERSGYYADFGPLAVLAKALARGWVHEGRWSQVRGRTHGRPLEGLAGSQLVVCAQNHDQVGNRAMGERLPRLVTRGRLELAAALLLTSPFTPLLFQGEEWAAASPFQYFTDHTDPELGRAVSEGRRREFSSFAWDAERVPDPQDPRTFERSKLDWEERSRSGHRETLAWYRSLLALRRARPELTDPRLDRVEVSCDEEAGWVLVRRGALAVAANVGEGEATVPLGGPARLLLASDSGAGVRLEGDAAVLPAGGVAVVEVDRG